MSESYFILEYSEEQGKFHLNDGSKTPESFGWSTICKSISYSQCLEFVKLMEEKFPSIKSNSKATAFPELETIREEFVEFLLS